MLGIDDDDDIDIFSKDDSLMNFYQEQNGPENETIYQFYSRSYQKLCNRIVAPERFKYDPTTDLAVEGYKHNEYDVYARGNTLHMCHWAPKDPKAAFSGAGSSRATAAESEDEEPEALPPLCIVYLHTNMRSLVDAKETIPIATMLGAHVISFDLPGCGKSEGQLGGNLDLDVEIILDWVQALIDPTVRIILWARGMSTAPAITLLRRFSLSQQQALKSKLSSSASNSSLASLDQSNNSGITSTASSTSSSRSGKKSPKTLADFHIIATILDSPFTSIEDMVQHGLEQFQGRGFSFTKTLLSFLIHRTLTHISKQLQGFNLFSVRPVEEVGDIACPVCIISASCDDYVPVQQGQCIAAQWATRVPLACYPPVDLVGKEEDITQVSSLHQCRQQLVEFHIFEEVTCKHFDPRPVSVVSLTESFLVKHITLNHQAAATMTTPAAILSTLKSMTTMEAEGSNDNNSVCGMLCKKSEASLSVSALISEGAEVSDVAIMQLAELENIANAIDAEVILKQQQQLDASSDGSATSSRSNGGKTPASPATKLTFSSSTSTLRTMTTSLGQSPWWSFSGRFLSSSSSSSSSAAAASSSMSTSSPAPVDSNAPSLTSPDTAQQVTGEATSSPTTASSPPSHATTPK